jgi:enoyl-CoA hydratase/carnithine racemase
VVGFHFFYPASSNRLVEVVEGEDGGAEAVSELWRDHEKSGMTVEEFDVLVAQATGNPPGPFRIADVPDHELLDTALAWARTLGGQALQSVGHIKRISAAGELDAGIAAEMESFAATFGSADGREGIAAFLAKRAPRWTGT